MKSPSTEMRGVDVSLSLLPVREYLYFFANTYSNVAYPFIILISASFY